MSMPMVTPAISQGRILEERERGEREAEQAPGHPIDSGRWVVDMWRNPRKEEKDTGEDDEYSINYAHGFLSSSRRRFSSSGSISSAAAISFLALSSDLMISSSLRCNAAVSWFWLFWIKKTMRNVIIVVPVLIIN
jgi:hypothetical protein